ncbi:MAG: hypothetical protein K5765_08565 [Clostridia bacterium]|nr:hypothetical protein [Clostridia bacterium]
MVKVYKENPKELMKNIRMAVHESNDYQLMVNINKIIGTMDVFRDPFRLAIGELSKLFSTKYKDYNLMYYCSLLPYIKSNKKENIVINNYYKKYLLAKKELDDIGILKMLNANADYEMIAIYSSRINAVKVLMQKKMYNTAYEIMAILTFGDLLKLPLKTLRIAIDKKEDVKFELFLPVVIQSLKDGHIITAECLRDIIYIAVKSNKDSRQMLIDNLDTIQPIISKYDPKSIIDLYTTIRDSLEGLDHDNALGAILNDVEIEGPFIKNDKTIDPIILYNYGTFKYIILAPEDGEKWINRLLTTQRIFNPPVELTKYLASNNYVFKYPNFDEVRKGVDLFVNELWNKYMNEETLVNNPEKYVDAYLNILAFKKSKKKFKSDIEKDILYNLKNRCDINKVIDSINYYLTCPYVSDSNKRMLVRLFVFLDQEANMCLVGSKKFVITKICKLSTDSNITFAKEIYSSVLEYLIFELEECDIEPKLLTEMIDKYFAIIKEKDIILKKDDFEFLWWFALDQYVTVLNSQLNFNIDQKQYDIPEAIKTKGFKKF